MKELFVNLKENSYYIKIGNGLLSNIGQEIREVFNGGKIFILTDHNVNSFYGEKVKNELIKSGYSVYLHSIEPGEESKSFNTLPSIYEKMLDFKLNRKDLVITLGGGVIGDLGGFAASSFLRGVPFVQVPTSLLSQVDSSVGGKVGVDLPQGKNLIGSFYQPKKVIIDTGVLDTLNDRFFRDGMAEVIKYGCIKDKSFFQKLQGLKSREEVMENIEEIVYTCCNIKRIVVEADERDMGERMLLNFGHTLGHAIEKYYNFTQYTHGEAIAIGMYQITLISEKMGLTIAGTSECIKDILVNNSLPFEVKLENDDEIINSISLDKKNLGDNLNIILIKEIGDSYIKNTNAEFFRKTTL